MIFNKLFKPLLFVGDPERTHDRISLLLANAGRSAGVRRALRECFDYDHPALATIVCGMRFRNPLGLAAGFDKQYQLTGVIPCLGFGHIEVGTITAKAQPGNPKPRMFRLPEDSALINRMGFNNAGAEAAKNAFQGLTLREAVIGINIGKSKATPLRDATKDYLYSFTKLSPFADYVVVNVSSPNTPGLRTLQDKPQLRRIMAALQRANKAGKPIFVKIAPDLTLRQVDDVVSLAREQALAGIIATNTTIDRGVLKSESREVGGISGQPLKERANRIVRHIYRRTRGKMPIIGVGGIFTPEDAYERIRSGASLVQAYTGFVYGGPSFAKSVNKGLVRLLQRDGLRNIAEAVGRDAR